MMLPLLQLLLLVCMLSVMGCFIQNQPPASVLPLQLFRVLLMNAVVVVVEYVFVCTSLSRVYVVVFRLYRLICRERALVYRTENESRDGNNNPTNGKAHTLLHYPFHDFTRARARVCAKCFVHASDTHNIVTLVNGWIGVLLVCVSVYIDDYTLTLLLLS